MMDQLELAATTTLFIVAIIFILLGTNKYHKRLKKVVSIQDNTIIALHKELAEYQKLYHIKQLEITRVTADNAVLKQRVINLESLCNNLNEWLDIIERYDIEITKDVDGKIIGVSREKALKEFFLMENEIIALNLEVEGLKKQLPPKEEIAEGPKIYPIIPIKKPKKSSLPKNKTTKKNKK